jgi:hypothetical protein
MLSCTFQYNTSFCKHFVSCWFLTVARKFQPLFIATMVLGIYATSVWCSFFGMLVTWTVSVGGGAVQEGST